MNPRTEKSMGRRRGGQHRKGEWGKCRRIGTDVIYQYIHCKIVISFEVTREVVVRKSQSIIEFTKF